MRVRVRARGLPRAAESRFAALQGFGRGVTLLEVVQGALGPSGALLQGLTRLDSSQLERGKLAVPRPA